MVADRKQAFAVFVVNTIIKDRIGDKVWRGCRIEPKGVSRAKYFVFDGYSVALTNSDIMQVYEDGFNDYQWLSAAWDTIKDAQGWHASDKLRGYIGIFALCLHESAHIVTNNLGNTHGDDYEKNLVDIGCSVMFSDIMVEFNKFVSCYEEGCWQ